jgi:DNA-directed RNA polymerase subunit RPC12/RpoP
VASDDDFQPLPDFDNVVVPETQPYICAECGQQHQAELVGQAPLGDMKIQLSYRAVECPNKDRLPAMGVVDGGPVVREAHDQ